MGEYSDDDLDDLPESALRQLENNAIQSTQALRSVTAAKQPLRPYPNPPSFDTLGLDDDDDLDLDDSDVFNQLTAEATPGGRAQPPAAPLADRTTFPDPSQAAPPPQRWNPRAPDAPANIPRPNAPVPPARRFQESQSFWPPALHNRPQPSQFPRGFAPPPPRYAPSQSQAPVHPNAVAALEQRLRSLETELNASKGEASILRANSTKAQQANVAELARLRRRNEELAAENERVLQKAVQAERTAATELEFAQREMHEVTSRARRRENAPGTTTPKKASRTWGVADGFDGMDLVPSPGKNNMSRTKSAPMPSMAERTPTRGKRKRFVESPVPPLETTEELMVADDGPAGAVDITSKLVTPVPAAAHSLPFDFLPLILDHSPAHGQPPTFDSFARYFYPSDPHTSFSSIIFQSLPTKTDPNYPIRILSDFSFLIINLWARCLQEEFFLPMRELVSLLTFTLQLHSISIVPELIDKLLPVAQTTLHVISDIRTAAAASENAGATGDLQVLRASLDSAAVVALLHLCALVCTTSTERLDDDGDTPREAFWKGFAMETVSLVLGSKQPLADIVGMLEMLSTSVLPRSIGPVAPDKEPPHVAVFLLDKLSKFLMYPPAAARSPTQRHAVAISALRTLVSFSASESAARQMATHDNLVLRLIATLSRSVDELYDQELSGRTLLRPRTTTTTNPPSAAVDDVYDAAMTLDEALAAASDRDSDAHGLCALISHAALLLHGLVTDPRTADLVGLERKFEGWRGGGRKYLVMLCRLNFAEDDGVLEAGIDVETAERAHELLEMFVSVEGGRDVGEAFGSPE